MRKKGLKQEQVMVKRDREAPTELLHSIGFGIACPVRNITLQLWFCLLLLPVCHLHLRRVRFTS